MNCRRRVGSVRCRRPLDFFPAVREVIDEEVFTEAVGAGVEGAAFVDAGHIVDETARRGSRMLPFAIHMGGAPRARGCETLRHEKAAC